jgi:hypothetical protein
VLDRDWVIAMLPVKDYVRTLSEEGEPDAEDEGEAYIMPTLPRRNPVLDDWRASSEPSLKLPNGGRDTLFLSVSRRGSVVGINLPVGRRLDAHPIFNPFSMLLRVPHVPLPADAPPAAEEMILQTSSAEDFLPPSKWATIVGGTVRLRELDLDTARVLNSCLAQTVNLQFFEGKVDSMYETVRQVHALVEAGSHSRHSVWAQVLDAFSLSSSSTDKNTLSTTRLYQDLAAVNAISNHVVLSGLRSTVRPGSTAWKEDRYEELQDLLWDDLDLEDRYEELQNKLSYVNDTIRYSLDVAKDGKSIFLERTIVVLIAAELALSLINVGVFSAMFDAVDSVKDMVLSRVPSSS